MTQPRDPSDEQGRPSGPAPSGDPAPPPPSTPPPSTPPASDAPTAQVPPAPDATRNDLPSEAPSYQSASQPPPADRPAFGPQYAYQYGQQYGGAAPGPGWPGEASTQARNGVGITALILGILTIIAFWIPFVSILLALAAIIFGIVGLRRVSKRIANNRAMPIIGIVLGVIGGILGTLLTIVVVVSARWTTDCINANPNASDEVIEQCLTDRIEERFGADLRPG